VPSLPIPFPLFIYKLLFIHQLNQMPELISLEPKLQYSLMLLLSFQLFYPITRQFLSKSLFFYRKNMKPINYHILDLTISITKQVHYVYSINYYLPLKILYIFNWLPFRCALRNIINRYYPIRWTCSHFCSKIIITNIMLRNQLDFILSCLPL